MLDLLTSFQRRKPNPHKLTAYGFAKDGTGYLFSASVPQSQIRITLHIGPKGKAEIQAVDGRTGGIIAMSRICAISIVKFRKRNML